MPLIHEDYLYINVLFNYNLINVYIIIVWFLNFTILLPIKVAIVNTYIDIIVRVPCRHAIMEVEQVCHCESSRWDVISLISDQILALSKSKGSIWQLNKPQSFVPFYFCDFTILIFLVDEHWKRWKITFFVSSST